MEKKSNRIMEVLRKAARKEGRGNRFRKRRVIAAGVVTASLATMVGVAGFYNISTRTMVERTNDMVLGADYVEWMRAQIKDVTYQSMEDYALQRPEGEEATLVDYINTNDIAGIADLVMTGIDERYEATGEAFTAGQHDQMVRIVESEINNSIEDALTDLTDQNVEAMTEKTYQYVAEYVSDHMKEAITKANETAELSKKTEKKTSEIEGKLTGQEGEIKALSEQSTKGEKAIAAANEKVAANEKAVAAANEKVAANEKAVAATNEKVAANEKAVAATNEKVAANEKAVAAANEKVAANEKAVAAANEKVAANEKAVAVANEKAAANEKAVALTNEKVATNEKAVAVVNEKLAENEKAVAIAGEKAATSERIVQENTATLAAVREDTKKNAEALATLDRLMDEKLASIPDHTGEFQLQDAKLSELSSKAGTNAEKLSKLQSQVDQDALNFSSYVADADGRFAELAARLAALEAGKGLDLDSIYPVGSIYISVSAESPAVKLGGEWQMVNAGKTLVGAGTATDALGQPIEFPAGTTGGEYSHVLSESQLPSHTHPFMDNMAAKLSPIRYPSANSSGGMYFIHDISVDTKEPVRSENTTGEAGGNEAVSLMQPYVVVYMWQRIS